MGHPLPEQHDTDRLARIFAMITNIDDNVGRLFASLDAAGLTENTIVVFLVDNGAAEVEHEMRGVELSIPAELL